MPRIVVSIGTLVDGELRAAAKNSYQGRDGCRRNEHVFQRLAARAVLMVAITRLVGDSTSPGMPSRRHGNCNPLAKAASSSESNPSGPADSRLACRRSSASQLKTGTKK